MTRVFRPWVTTLAIALGIGLVGLVAWGAVERQAGLVARAEAALGRAERLRGIDERLSRVQWAAAFDTDHAPGESDALGASFARLLDEAAVRGDAEEAALVAAIVTAQADRLAAAGAVLGRSREGAPTSDLWHALWTELAPARDRVGAAVAALVEREEERLAQARTRQARLPLLLGGAVGLGGLALAGAATWGQRRTVRALRRRSRRERAHLASIVESSSDAIVGVGLDDRIVSWNGAAARLFGWQAAEAIGRHAVVLVPDDRREEAAALAARVRRGDRVDPVDTVLRRRDGTTVEVSLSVGPIRAGGLAGFACVARDVGRQREAERRLRESLAEKEVLLREIHHRVKNNLQVISSLLNLAQGDADERVFAAFADTRNRIRSIALLHEKLYRAPDLARVGIEGYLRDLAEDLRRQFAADPSTVTISVAAPGVRLGVDRAIPCGLIAGELVTNALKYAFRDRPGGSIALGLAEEPGGFRFEVADDGVGLPAGLDPRTTSTLGLQLVATLIEQLAGTVELDRSGGTRFTIRFPA